MFHDDRESDKTCSGCGSVYQITSTKYPVRDPGSIDCSVCGARLLSWTGSRDYHATLKTPAKHPQTKEAVAPKPIRKMTK